MCLHGRVACLTTGGIATYIRTSLDFDDIRVQYAQKLLYVRTENGTRHDSSTITLGYFLGGDG
jgi:hypothetical protein